MVSISACHAEDPGSIPGLRAFYGLHYFDRLEPEPKAFMASHFAWKPPHAFATGLGGGTRPMK